MKEETIKISQDGDMICVLLGENLQEGLAGFGEDIPTALKNFADNWGAEHGICNENYFGVPENPITDSSNLIESDAISKE